MVVRIWGRKLILRLRSGVRLPSWTLFYGTAVAVGFRPVPGSPGLPVASGGIGVGCVGGAEVDCGCDVACDGTDVAAGGSAVFAIVGCSVGTTRVAVGRAARVLAAAAWVAATAARVAEMLVC